MAAYDNPTLLDYMGWKKKVRPERKKGGTMPRHDKVSELAKGMAAASARRPAPPRVQARQDVNLDCPHCSQNLDVPVTMIGQSFACPACEGEIRLEGA